MEDECGRKLVQLQIIHRHGARSPARAASFPSICGQAAFRTFLTFTPRLPPVSLYPYTPHRFEPSDTASCYAGQLTPVGAAQMFALGARLRARYGDFLPERFDEDKVSVRSTAMRRTVESAMATLSGMFPARGKGELGREVSVEVRARPMETMVGMRRMCNRLFDLQMGVHRGYRGEEVLTEEAQEVLGGERGVGASHQVIMLRDVAIAVRENGCEPKRWEGVADRAAEMQILRIYGRESWGLSLGRFVEELLENAEKHKSVPWRVKIFSGHDTTLLPLMGCFEDSANRGIPEFAADVVLETWDDGRPNTEAMVRLRYEGEEVVIKGCEAFGSLCPVSMVRRAVRERVPQNLEKACQGTAEDRKGNRAGRGKKIAADDAEGTTL